MSRRNSSSNRNSISISSIDRQACDDKLRSCESSLLKQQRHYGIAEREFHDVIDRNVALIRKNRELQTQLNVANSQIQVLLVNNNLSSTSTMGRTGSSNTRTRTRARISRSRSNNTGTIEPQVESIQWFRENKKSNNNNKWLQDIIPSHRM